MNFKAKSIKMPGKRQRADAYRGVDLLTAKRRQGYPADHSVRGEGKNRLTHKKVVREAKTF